MTDECTDTFSILRTDPRFGHIGLALWIAMLVVTVVSGVYVLLYILFILGYLLFVTQIEDMASRYEPLRRFVARPAWQHFLVVTVVALALRWVILLQDQVITGDLETTIRRSERMMDGLLPYQDFSGGTKPPAYQYMLYLMGLMVEPSYHSFRAIFSVGDALVAGILYLACRTRSGTGHSLAMAMVYATCPVAIVSVGLSGRYDGMVNIFLIAALWGMLSRRYDTSAILLGVGFSLKIYPAAVLPFMAVAATKMAGNWDRGMGMRLMGMARYGGLFALPMLVSFIPLGMVDSGALEAYFAERGVFKGWGSYTTWVRNVLGFDHIGDVHVAYVFLAIFGVLLLLLFLDWLKNGPVALRRWTRIVMVAIGVHYGFYLSLGFEFYQSPNWEVLTIAFVIGWMVLMVPLYRWFLKDLDLGTDEELGLDRTALPLVGALALFLFVFAMPTIGTWYFLWPLPFVLVIGTRDVRETMLWLMFWHAIGAGVSLLPGMPPVN
jgi:hypothetical protein